MSSFDFSSKSSSAFSIAEGFAIGASFEPVFSDGALEELSRWTIGRASLTVSGRPSMSFPFISEIAF